MSAPARKESGRFYLEEPPPPPLPPPAPPQPLLWEKFGLYGRLGQVYDVKLHETRISVVKEESSGSAALEVGMNFAIIYF